MVQRGDILWGYDGYCSYREDPSRDADESGGAMVVSEGGLVVSRASCLYVCYL